MAFLKLIRYKNLLMVLLTMVLTKYALFSHYPSSISLLTNIQFFLLSLSIICITAGGYIINDYFDIKADEINKPNNVFVGINFTKKQSLIFFTILFLKGLTLSIYISTLTNKTEYSFIFLATAIALYLYSFWLKKIPLLGNLMVSVFVTLIYIIIKTFDYGGGNTDIEIILYGYCIFSFLTTLIREIIKDIEDIDGDHAINSKSLPILIGRKRARRIALGFTFLLLIFLVIAIREFIQNFPYLLGYTLFFIFFPLLYFTYKLLNAETKSDFHFLSITMKIIMFIGILSMLIFAF